MRLFFESALSVLKHTKNISHYYETAKDAVKFQLSFPLSHKKILKTPGKY